MKIKTNALSLKNESKRFLLIVICVILLESATVVSAQYPVLANLDLLQIQFSISTMLGRESADRLHNHAIHKFVEAGIDVNDRASKDDQLPLLKVTLEVVDLGDDGDFPQLGKTCPGKVLYMRKIELWEYVYAKRNPEMRILAVTWSRVVPMPTIVRGPSIEQLENDLDRFLSEFISDYKQAKAQDDKKRR